MIYLTFEKLWQSATFPKYNLYSLQSTSEGDHYSTEHMFLLHTETFSNWSCMHTLTRIFPTGSKFLPLSAKANTGSKTGFPIIL